MHPFVYLIPEDPALAAIIAEAMAAEFKGVEATNADECRAKDPAHCPTHGTSVKAATEAEIKSFLADPPSHIDHEKAKSILKTGFTDKDADGNQVKYGQLLLDHICDDRHSENDQKARLRMLGTTVNLVRSSKPMKTDRAGGLERIYSGTVNGKAYVAVADEHNEISAMVMVSYRRDRENDPKVKA